MTVVSSTAAAGSARPARPAASASAVQAPRPIPAWLREPLLHFMLLGGALFAVDHLLVARSDDPHVIVVDAAVDQQAKDVFAAARGRQPSAAELAALRRVWLDNEVLYREGLAMQVDKGDTAIRERVIFKALTVVDANTRLPEIDDAALRAWFEKNRSRYDEPARFDFQEAVPTGQPSSEAAVRSLVATLDTQPTGTIQTPGEANADLRVFKGRPWANLVQSYGPAFASALQASPVGQWRTLPSSDGVRAIRLEATLPPKPAVFEVLRGMVRQDWADATLSEQRSAAVQQMAKKYRIKTEGVSP